MGLHPSCPLHGGVS